VLVSSASVSLILARSRRDHVVVVTQPRKKSLGIMDVFLRARRALEDKVDAFKNLDALVDEKQRAAAAAFTSSVPPPAGGSTSLSSTPSLMQSQPPQLAMAPTRGSRAPPSLPPLVSTASRPCAVLCVAATFPPILRAEVVV
jgi:hypothetical protein